MQWRNDGVAVSSSYGGPDKERKGQTGHRPEKVTGVPGLLRYATVTVATGIALLGVLCPLISEFLQVKHHVYVGILFADEGQ